MAASISERSRLSEISRLTTVGANFPLDDPKHFRLGRRSLQAEPLAHLHVVAFMPESVPAFMPYISR